MKAAYIEETGPPEVIKVGDLPEPEPGPGQVLVKVHAAALNPIDLYLRSGLVPMPLSFPYVIGCDLAGTVERGRARRHALQGRRPRLGLEPGAARPPGRRRRVRGRRRGVALPNSRPFPTTRPRRWPWSASPPTSGCSGSASSKAASRSTFPAARGGVGSMVVQMAKAAGRPGRHLRRQSRASRALPQPRAPTSPSTTRPTTSPRGFASSRPKASTSGTKPSASRTSRSPIPLLRKHGRMILMAGRTAKPALPLGAFYPRNCAIFGFAMFNAPPEEQRHCAAEHHPLVIEEGLSSRLSAAPSRWPAADAQRFPRRQHLEGRRLLDRKSRDHHRMVPMQESRSYDELCSPPSPAR